MWTVAQLALVIATATDAILPQVSERLPPNSPRVQESGGIFTHLNEALYCLRPRLLLLPLDVASPPLLLCCLLASPLLTVDGAPLPLPLAVTAAAAQVALNVLRSSETMLDSEARATLYVLKVSVRNTANKTTRTVTWLVGRYVAFFIFDIPEIAWSGYTMARARARA